MKYNDSAQLDTSGVQDARGGRLTGRSGLAVGGGGLGVLGVVAYLLFSLIGGGSGNAVNDVLGQLGQGRGSQSADNTEVAKQCKTGGRREHQAQLRGGRRHRLDSELLGQGAAEARQEL